ncbi:MAG: glycolate oxidase subunit GlcE [Pseudomonadales bacterium]|nr:glycolate oxidase subunit GlcE [Pseudomonadales bacterium]
MSDQDQSGQLQRALQSAYSYGSPLRICGSGSKDFYAQVSTGTVLSTTDHRGIVDYQPGELTLTARAGTPLRDIDAALAGQGQMLSCEPPHFGPDATFGGMLASGLSGPRRPFGGSLADLVLGCRMLNGKGEMLRFGGKVMKNVAGYDLSRLLVGSLGCLGVILEATIRVQPRPGAEQTFRFTVTPQAMAGFMNGLSVYGYPVSASCHDGEALLVRFSAGEQEIATLRAALQKQFAPAAPEPVAEQAYWEALREHRHPFFQTQQNLWRLSLAPNTPIPDLPGEILYEWNGALRWLRSAVSPEDVFAAMAACQGSASLFKAATEQFAGPRFQPLSPALLNWHKNLKLAFDPGRILNRGRMYQEF